VNISSPKVYHKPIIKYHNKSTVQSLNNSISLTPGRDADHSAPFSAEVKNQYSSPPWLVHGSRGAALLCKVRHRHYRSPSQSSPVHGFMNSYCLTVIIWSPMYVLQLQVTLYHGILKIKILQILIPLMRATCSISASRFNDVDSAGWRTPIHIMNSLCVIFSVLVTLSFEFKYYSQHFALNSFSVHSTFKVTAHVLHPQVTTDEVVNSDI
jgi:hypothetical protein